MKIMWWIFALAALLMVIFEIVRVFNDPNLMFMRWVTYKPSAANMLRR